MAPLTWRNVANTVTGNPAAALSAATSAFTQAGDSARANVEGIQEREQLERDKYLREAQGLALDADGLTEADKARFAGKDVDWNAIREATDQSALRQAQAGLAVSQTGKVGAETKQIETMLPLEILQMGADLGYTRQSTELLSEQQRVSLLRMTPERQKLELGKMIADINYTGALQEGVEQDTTRSKTLLPGEVTQQLLDAGFTQARIDSLSEEQRASLINNTQEGRQAEIENLKQSTATSAANAAAIISGTAIAEDDAPVNRANVASSTALNNSRREAVDQETATAKIADAPENVRKRSELELENQELTNKSIAAGTAAVEAGTEGQKNLNRVFDEVHTKNMALKDENLRGLIVDREGAKQIQTQSGEIHTDWQKQRRKDENTAVAMARLQSLTPAEREQVRLDPSDWFSKFEDVNTKELIDYIQADESHRSRLATEQVNRMNAQEDLRWKEATQSGKHLDLYNRQLEIDVELAENSNTYRKDQIDALKEEREDIRYKREQAIEADKTTRAIDTGWQNKVADYMSGPQQAFDEKVKEIEQDSSLTEAEKVAKIMFGEEALAEMQALYEDGAPALSYLQEFKRNNADASQMGISNSEVATIVAGRREEAQNIRRINAEAEADIATRDTDYLKTAASGGDLSRFRFNEATNSVEILSPEDAKYNRLTLEEAENDILAKGKEDKALSFGTTGLLDWWGRDPGLTKNNQNLVKDLWNAVGKNRQLWNKLTDPVEYNIELGFLKDGDDRIENLPTSGQVMAVAQKLRDEASKQASDAQRPKYTAQEATDQLFGSWLNN